MAHKTTYLILLVLGLIISLFWASPALAQSPEYLFLFIFLNKSRPEQRHPFSSGEQMPPEFSQMCLGMVRRSDEFDSMLYSLGGVGGALDPQRINWTLVQSYLAVDFIWQDYSPVPVPPKSRPSPAL
jgi:hypothetical protein